MTWTNRLLELLGIETISITLVGQKREGGYVFITSPDLPGFTFLLEPNEIKDIRALQKALDLPLKAFLSARDAAQGKSMQVKRIRQATPMNYVADLCPA